ncbi:MAG: MBL fold metallo-hydrolase [Candidatus Omnitrophica bacterium]|nr:MBL fold metallo-hydrolase [Candidatus Omnitrophota bacterium]
MGFIKFLGTAGARFVMIRQLRSSGGLWFNYKTTNIMIDPGPGALLRCNSSRPKLDPTSLDGIILTHKHLDHSNDINVMIEAMTEGGFRKRGIVFVPRDALDEKEGVIFSYVKDLPKEIAILREGNYKIGDVRFEVPVRNIHSVETYGLKFKIQDQVISLVSDTKYFENLSEAYKDSTVLILNVVFYQKKEEYEHLCLEEALKLAERVRPKLTIFTHFGMSMLKAKPHLLEGRIRNNSKLNIKFAYDGFNLEIPLPKS